MYKEIQAKIDNKQKGVYENFMKIIEKDASKEYLLPNKDYSNRAMKKNYGPDEIEGAQTNLCELQRSTVESEMRKEQFVKCYEGVQYSCFNPVPPARKLAGDLFYLTVKTLDAGEKGITCCVNGFYINDSVEKSSFKPGPSQRKNTAGKSMTAFSYTLIGCLNQVSTVFGKNLEKYINQILNTE